MLYNPVGILGGIRCLPIILYSLVSSLYRSAVSTFRVSFTHRIVAAPTFIRKGRKVARDSGKDMSLIGSSSVLRLSPHALNVHQLINPPSSQNHHRPLLPRYPQIPPPAGHPRRYQHYTKSFCVPPLPRMMCCLVFR